MRLIQKTIILLLLGISFSAMAQIDSLVVETYYISDEKDATDADGGNLEAGSVTYRIFLDLSDGYSLTSIFGTSNLPLIFSSTEGIFNNLDRGEKFGYTIGANRLEDNTTGLDSWVTLGYASNAHLGVLKEEDDDGSIIGGVNNDGGSEDVAGGLLTNNAAEAGIPLVESDGIVVAEDIPDFVDFGISDTSAFGDTFKKQFIGREVALTTDAQIGGTSDKNLVLIAQITTRGTISLRLNVALKDSLGNSQVYKYSNDMLAEGEFFSKWLSYPFKTGCTDPDYLEYDPGAIISDQSCATAILYGCMDQDACNYDPGANFNIHELCCYSETNCGGRDIYEVCENYTGMREEAAGITIKIFPNPAFQVLNIDLPDPATRSWQIALRDISGRLIQEGEIPVNHTAAQLDVSQLNAGIYMVMVSDGQLQYTGKVMIN